MYIRPSRMQKKRPISTYGEYTSYKRRRGQDGNSADIQDDIVDNTEWISASSIKNYMIKDPILDWLKFQGPRKGLVPMNANIRKSVYTDFASYISNKGCDFETAVITYISNFVKITRVAEGPQDIISWAKYWATIEAMKRGDPVIYQGVLRNYTNHTFGSPDLLVRSDRANMIFPSIVAEDAGSPALRTRYHYIVIDIKYTTMKMKANGMTMGNSEQQPYYKGQIIIYNMALGQMTGYTPRHCYVLGRGYSYKSRGQKYDSGNCLERLGKICPEDEDNAYYGFIERALIWLRRVKSEGKEWVVLPQPTVPELYPNMCNQRDAPYTRIKHEIAEQLHDIIVIS
jgi:hypothetical protein